MSIKKETLRNNINYYFIETGTYRGETTRCAFDNGFQEVHTIELQDRLYEESKNNLSDIIQTNRVFLHNGDSGVVLGDILSKINSKTTILLEWGTEVVLDDIISMIMEINKNYKISFDEGEIENDVLIAKI